MNTLAPSFLIGSSSFLQVSRTTIKSRVGSKGGSSTLYEIYVGFCPRTEFYKIL